MRRIGIDGFNLAMAKGSGIATYARNLNLAVRGLGHQTHLLYGPDGGLGRNPVLNEVALSDAVIVDSRKNARRRMLASLTSPLGRRARRIPKSGLVQPSPAMSRAEADVVWAAEDVFHTANRAYVRSKILTPVTFAEPGSSTPEMMHWTCPLPLRAKGMANLYTIHDLVPLKLPFTTLDNKRRFHRLCKTLCRQADHIVTVSESARRDIIAMFGVAEDRITNTYQAAILPPALLARSDADVAREVEGLFNLPWCGYFLFFGAIEPKKNLGRVIEAYLSSGVTAPLVIIGGAAWLDELETKMIYDDLVTVQAISGDRIRRADRIRRYDYLPLHSLVSLIRGAKATLFPSLYEGFGLPVLESMMLGAPVLTSTAGSLPEVAGDAALSVHPHDLDAMVRGIRDLDNDEALRRDLSTRGRLQAAKFSLEAYQGRLGALYAQLH